jgi:hypothetical protein
LCKQPLIHLGSSYLLCCDYLSTQPECPQTRHTPTHRRGWLRVLSGLDLLADTPSVKMNQELRNVNSPPPTH